MWYRKRRERTLMHDTKTDKKQLTVIALSILGAAALILATVFIIWQPFQNNESAPAAGGMQIQKGAVDYNTIVPDKSDDGSSQPGIKIPGYPVITIKAGENNIPLTLLNPEGNPCYFAFTVRIDGKPCYKTQLVEPGKAVRGFSTGSAPSPGTHELSVQIDTYSLSGKVQMNGAQTKTTLTVTNA